MLAVHWTPVANTKKIFKNGITRSKTGLYCFPLTGHKDLDKWWVNYFNQYGARSRKKYNGIVFRVLEEDLPAYFGHWIGATTRDKFTKPITSLSQLGKDFRETIIWRMGEQIAQQREIPFDYKTADQLYEQLGNEAIQHNPKSFFDYYNDESFMSFALEDYQIVLSNSIPAKRIIKVLPQGNEFGKVLRKQKMNKKGW